MIKVLTRIISLFAVIALTLFAWVMTPSALFLNPLYFSLEGTKQTTIRETPFGDVDVRWVGEITMADGTECTGHGQYIAQDQPGNMVITTIQPWAMDCINAGPPFVLRYRLQVMLFGIIPLRPVDMVTTVDESQNEVTP